MKTPSKLSSFARIVFCSTLFLSVATAPVVAQSDQPDWAADMFDRMEPMVETYNENINADDAGIAGDQLKNEKVNLIVTDANGTTAEASFRLDGRLRMQELSEGTRDDATMKMSTDRETIERIIDANDPSSAFQTAITDDDISIDGLGSINAVKWVILNTVSGFLR